MADIAIRDYLRETGIIQSRMIFAGVLVVLAIALLIARLIQLQVMDYERYATLSQDNRIHLIPIPPVRGLISDRNGVVLAQNFPVYNLEVTPDQMEDMEATIDGLSRIVQITEADMSKFRRLLARRPGFESLILRTNLTPAEAARFAVNQYGFPGVQVRATLQRYYPEKALTGHVVGYVGRISENDLQRIDRARYSGTQHIGKLGIEAHYEDTLLGRPGFEQVETNAHGRVVRLLSRTPPASGRHLRLSLDVGLQQVAHDALGDYEGAVVAIEPDTGALLAFVSKPSYDTNLFVNGIDEESYRLLRENPGRPLLNRALHGRYAPGSTIKGFMGLAELETGRSPGRVFCKGWYSLPNSRHRYRDWKRGGHGSMDLHNAIEQSCDVYFYQLAKMMGIARMREQMTRFGFGTLTGIDLDGEPTGLMPSADWKKEVRGEPWYPGETVIAGIGQGYVLVTPLQLAAATAALANRGRRVVPALVHSVEDAQSGERTAIEPLPVESVKLRSDRYFDVVIDAMTDVVHGDRGTARKIGTGSPYRIAGKTGTAQVIGIKQGQRYDEDKIAKRFRDHALFIAFAPVENPRIAVAVVAENGGGGSRTAAPIAKRVMDYFLIDQFRPLEPQVIGVTEQS